MPVYVPRYGKSADFAYLNPVLQKTEVGVEIDTSPTRIKYGDGVRAYRDLPYVGTGGGSTTTTPVDGTFRGVWDSTVEYAVNDMVVYSGVTYYATVAHVSGDTFTASNWDILPVSTSSSGAATSYRATLNTSVTSDTSLNTDTNFPTMPVLANSVYQLDLTLMWDLAVGGGTGTDVKVGMTGPTGVGGYWGAGWQQPIATGTAVAALTTFPSAVQLAIGEGVYGTAIRAVVTTAGTPGNLALQFAQVVTSTATLTRLAGSNILVRKLP